VFAPTPFAPIPSVPVGRRCGFAWRGLGRDGLGNRQLCGRNQRLVPAPPFEAALDGAAVKFARALETALSFGIAHEELLADPRPARSVLVPRQTARPFGQMSIK
jgi:hypothetical protein